MARKKEPYVLLGYEDEIISEKQKSFIDYTTNKIGGKPDWYHLSETPLTQCRLCGSNLPLVVQIYAPLEGSKYHRTLYLFACIQPLCWNRSESWLCICQQVLSSPSEGQTSVVAEPATSSVSFWNSEADNWDSEGDIIPSVDQENGNIVLQRPMNHREIQRLQEDTDTDDSSSLSLEDANDPNANSAEGAFAIEFNNKVHIASAEIEVGDETEIVSIDTPTKPILPVSELFRQANTQKFIEIRHPVFLSSYICVLEEVLQGNNAKLSDHEMSLLQQYQQGELGAGEFNLEGRDCSASGGGGGGGELTLEQYEKETPSHGDFLAHRFISQIQKSPGQILRYCRESDPLLLQPLQKSQGQRCQYCGGDLIFELQLLPPLLTKLTLVSEEGRRDIEEYRNPALEFGTVLVFTCKNACWSLDGIGCREEHVIVQAETI